MIDVITNGWFVWLLVCVSAGAIMYYSIENPAKGERLVAALVTGALLYAFGWLIDKFIASF